MKTVSTGPAEAPKVDLRRLIDLLHRTSARIEELTGGEVDAVTDSKGRPFLLRSAQEHLRQIDASRQAAILDALPAHIAVLDPTGRIVSVNKAWRRFGQANAFVSRDSGVGDNYVTVCDKAMGETAGDANRTARGIVAVLSGSEASFSLEYACHSATEKRWFLMTVTPLSGNFRAGAVVMHVNITTEKQAALELEESETRFSSAFEDAPIGVALVSIKGRWLRVNRALCALLGYSKAELLSSTVQAITHPDDLEADITNVRRLLAGDVLSYQMEKRYLHAHGRLVSASLNVSLFRDRFGAPSYFIAHVLDITDRKSGEDALKRSEEEFRTLAECMPQMVWITRPDGWNVYFSQQWMAYTGLTLEESLGHGWNQPFHPDDQKRAWEAWQDATTTVGTYSIECRLRRADGVYRWWLIRGAPIKDGKGTILKWFGTCTDIHDLKVAELEIERSNRVYAMLSGINTLIVRVRDRDQLFKEACQIAVAAGGFRMSLIAVVDPQTEAIVPVASAGKDEGLLEEVARILANAETAPTTMVVRAMRDKTPVVSNDSLKDPRLLLGKRYRESGVRSLAILPLLIADEAAGVLALYSSEVEFFQEEELRLLADLANNIAFCMGALRSRAERDQADAALRASLKEKESLLKEKESLLKEVHHRVKNNMQVVTSLLRLESNRIDHQTTRSVLKAMQNRILAMSALHETVYRSSSFAQVDLASYLKQLTDQLSRSLVATPGQITFDLDLVVIPIDLEQAIPCGLIVNELVSNALKHGFPGGRTGEIRIEVERLDEDMLRLRVSDNGVGIPPNFAERQTQSLGLQLVGDLAKQLGGRLLVGLGPGALFDVTFRPSSHGPQ